MLTDDHSHKMTWRKFQQGLQIESRREKSRKTIKTVLFLLLLSITIASVAVALQNTVPLLPAAAFSSFSKGVAGIKTAVKETALFFENFFFSPDSTVTGARTDRDSDRDSGRDSDSDSGRDSDSDSEKVASLTRQDVNKILDSHPLLNIRQNHFTVNKAGLNLTVNTTLDMKLQHFILDKLETLRPLERGTPEIIAMVVMEPHTGRILAMAGFDNETPGTNPCTKGEYPAASIFKMVTASAAVETCGYTPATTLFFNGGKYTLYKRQLKDTHNKYSNKVTFASAFAQSINPVFGKLGSIKLGGDILEKYARSFGFNQQINSDIPFTPGSILITENAYQWAEVASGFNKTTTISPIFGAMLASTILNAGKMHIPCMVESVMDDKRTILYKRKNEVIGSAVKPETARAVMTMMNRTITKGTAKKQFRGLHKDATLSKLNIGGKTGSLYNKEHTVKFDWFTGFCKENQGKEQIVVSVVVGHGKYIGTRAGRYGRMIFKEYFNNFYAINSKQPNKG